MTIQHVVLIEFKDGTTDAERQIAMDQLNGLGGKIPGLTEIKVGKNFSERAGKIEVAAVMTLTDRAALDAYGPHDAHQAAIGAFGGFVENLTVVDFEE
jgi:hypothetical protein